jgi:putative oxidoreductase
MTGFMKKYDGEAYALLRIIAGLLFLWHGTQKLFSFPAAMGVEVPAFVVYVAGPIELIGGVLIAIGLFTRWSAFVCSGLMAAAYWMAHGTQSFWPMLNKGELAILYCFVFLFIAAHGAGKWSADGARAASD